MSGPNIKNVGTKVWATVQTNWTSDYIAINKMLPTVALHYIKRVSNPW